MATYLSLLAMRKELVFRLLRMTNDTALKEASAEKNAENYIEFIDAREGIIKELKALEGELERHGAPPLLSEEAALLIQGTKEMADQIARLEPRINRKASGIKNHFQQQIRNINERKKTTGMYEPGLLYESKV